MTEEDLKRLDALMSQRDHASIKTDVARASIVLGLADEVPGLVAEVRRLKSELIKAYEPVDRAGEIQ